MEILLASTNPHKIEEFNRLFLGSGIRVMGPGGSGPAPLNVPETGQTFLENAMLKALAYMEAYSIPALADDSGICVDALAGAPGVRSARFGPPYLDDAGRVTYLLDQMRDIPPPKRTAHYVCTLVLAGPSDEPIIATGMCYGEVAAEPHEGSTGFGYDPVFIVPSYGTTVSKLTPEQKDTVGHRGKAVRRLLHALRQKSPGTGTLKG
ncbi:MAG: XTP/dITP diphosphatase [Chloroflexi bacterium]|jgi:XTP/dITP diphosphohydrolase|nr:XTP/dITP diphosphatase [Chloroflexota bacterium]